MYDNSRAKDEGKLEGTLVRLVYYVRSDILTHGWLWLKKFAIPSATTKGNNNKIVTLKDR